MSAVFRISGDLDEAENGKVVLVIDRDDCVFVAGFFSALTNHNAPEPVRTLLHQLAEPPVYEAGR